MKILKVEKDKVQVELTREDVEEITSGLAWGEHETCAEEYAHMEDEFSKVLSKMDKAKNGIKLC